MNFKRLRDGDPSVLLPVLHYCLLGYSAKLAKLISSKGFELQAKTDERFVEHCWRFLREHFNFMPQLNQHQFLSKGFTERKLILVTDVAKLCKQHHHLLTRKAKLQTKRVPKVSRNRFKAFKALFEAFVSKYSGCGCVN